MAWQRIVHQGLYVMLVQVLPQAVALVALDDKQVVVVATPGLRPRRREAILQTRQITLRSPTAALVPCIQVRQFHPQNCGLQLVQPAVVAHRLVVRSEERRVGKECRYRWWGQQQKKI